MLSLDQLLKTHGDDFIFHIELKGRAEELAAATYAVPVHCRAALRHLAQRFRAAPTEPRMMHKTLKLRSYNNASAAKKNTT